VGSVVLLPRPVAGVNNHSGDSEVWFKCQHMSKRNIKITVKLFATLRRGRFENDTKKFPSATTVRDVIEKLNIPDEKVSIIFVNGRHAKREHKLEDGDRLALFPPVGGG
jgi:molybdopterin synthase sulfur carrier subunit